MPVYVRSRGRWFKKRDGKGGEMIKITREPVAFHNLTAAELAADHWLEVIDPPATSVKKKRARKAAATKPKPPPPKPAPTKPAAVGSGGDLFGAEETAPAATAARLEPEGLVD